MGEPAKKAEFVSDSLHSQEIPEEVYRSIRELLEQTHSEELVISLCGFIGTDVHDVANKLKYILENVFSYEVEIIKLSNYIKHYSPTARSLTIGLSSYEYHKILIDEGNELRSVHSNSILVELAIQKISFDRLKDRHLTGAKAYKTRRKCYLIDSVKNIEELQLLEFVYRDIHYSIGIFSPIEVRRNNLRIHQQMDDSQIDSLIDRDSGEELAYGQKVRDTFVQSDFFLRLESHVNEVVGKKLERFLHLIFGSKVITPTIEETAMYQAASAANNSACLSRQVGAALTDENGEVLSIGWNDVPKAGGGLYHTSSKDLLGENDLRCCNIGSGCWNDKEKTLMSNELVNILIKDGLVDESKREELYNKVRNSKIKSLVEFSRAIHAEMHAIITASQTAGERVKGGSIYITTYPCHNCARHIIVAGVKKVYYIEPYRKSLTTKLHSDAITENESETDKVVILMYDGVSPARYMQLFKMTPNVRKGSSGEQIDYNLKDVKPKSTLSLEAIPVLELKVAGELKKKGLEIASHIL
jgi:deoxycytidylate deaminase